MLSFIPVKAHETALGLIGVIRDSGLMDDFDVAVALYRWTSGRPEYIDIHHGLKKYLDFEALKYAIRGI